MYGNILPINTHIEQQTSNTYVSCPASRYWTTAAPHVRCWPGRCTPASWPMLSGDQERANENQDMNKNAITASARATFFTMCGLLCGSK